MPSDIPQNEQWLAQELDKRVPPRHTNRVPSDAITPPSPEAQAEMEGLLMVAERLGHAPLPTLTLDAHQRIEARLREARPRPAPMNVRRLPLRSFAVKLIAACLVLVFLAMGSLQASANSVPGDVLYPVKRSVEDIRLAFSSGPAKADLQVAFAERRLDEFEILLDEGTVSLDLLEDADQRLQEAAALSRSPQNLEDRVALAMRQQALLERLPTDAPDNTQATAQATVTQQATVAISPPSTATLDQVNSVLNLENECARGHGYWRNHLAQWPIETLVLGGQTYLQSELLALLENPTRGDASIILARQLITAYLNSPTEANADMVEADALLTELGGKLPLAIDPSSNAGQTMVDLAEQLQISNLSLVEDDNCEPAQEDLVELGEGDATQLNCNNPPPAHAPAIGWHTKCGGEPGQNNGNQGNNGNNGNGKGNNGNNGNGKDNPSRSVPKEE